MNKMIALGTPLIFGATLTSTATPVSKPNIVFILGDDVAYGDLSCFGQRHFSTRDIDRQAREGRVFSNAYAGASWCAPSRACLLTGMNTAHLNSLGKDAHGVPTKYRPTVAEMLKSNGYATCILGKWHMLEDNQDAGVTDKAPRAQLPWNRGFDVCRIVPWSANLNFPQYFHCGNGQTIPIPENRGADGGDSMKVSNCLKFRPGTYRADGLYVDLNGKTGAELIYSEDYYRKTAREFIRENAQRKQPFFLYYASFLTHRPLITKSLREFAKQPASWTTAHKALAAMTEDLDDSVGEILDELKEQGLEKNTLVIFSSDNGYTAGYYFGHRIWEDDPLFQSKGPWFGGKHGNANGGVHIPFIARGPMVKPGTSERAICYTDFMPTVGELTGARLPGPTDGVSIVPLLQGRDQEQPPHPDMLWTKQSCWYALDGVADQWETDPSLKSTNQFKQIDAALLDERWYAIGFHKTNSTPPLVIRIFDIPADPGMTHDLSYSRPDLCARATVWFRRK